MNILICFFYCFFQISEIFSCCRSFQCRKPRNLINTSSCFQKVTVYTAAAISVSKGNQQVFVHFFFTVCIPYAFYCFCSKKPVIGIEPGAWLIPWFRSGDKVCQHFASVHTFPVESIMWHTVKLVPADFGSHKHINTRFFQNLR